MKYFYLFLIFILFLCFSRFSRYLLKKENYFLNLGLYMPFIFFVSCYLIYLLYFTLKHPLLSVLVLGIIFIQLILITIIDIKYKEISHGSEIVLGILALIYIYINNYNLIEHILSAVILFVVFFICYLLLSIGGGDVKLSFPIGLFIPYMLLIDYVYLMTFFSAIVCVIILVLTKKKKMKIAFAPYMSLALMFILI